MTNHEFNEQPTDLFQDNNIEENPIKKNYVRETPQIQLEKMIKLY